ncbi:MAG: AMP-binding protein, partial [SAR324 cluster bacterium]|nr:AMP-binding protein [SAR324 cluster bacterium]
MNWLQKQNQQDPQVLFIQEGGHAYSFMDVFAMVQTYSRSLLREGIQPQDRIIICLPSGTQMAEIILACFEIGAIATPISPMLSERERRAVIEKIT